MMSYTFTHNPKEPSWTFQRKGYLTGWKILINKQGLFWVQPGGGPVMPPPRVFRQARHIEFESFSEAADWCCGIEDEYRTAKERGDIFY